MGDFLVTMVAHAEFNVPNPMAMHTAQIITVNVEGMYAIKNNPTDCAIIPVMHIIKSPPES